MIETLKVKASLLRGGANGLRQATSIITDLDISELELSQIRAAARQAEQAAADFNKLAGILELEFVSK